MTFDYILISYRMVPTVVEAEAEKEPWEVWELQASPRDLIPRSIAEDIINYSKVTSLNIANKLFEVKTI